MLPNELNMHEWEKLRGCTHSYRCKRCGVIGSVSLKVPSDDERAVPQSRVGKMCSDMVLEQVMLS